MIDIQLEIDKTKKKLIWLDPKFNEAALIVLNNFLENIKSITNITDQIQKNILQKMYRECEQNKNINHNLYLQSQVIDIYLDQIEFNK